MIHWFKGLVTSKKFQALVVGGTVVIANHALVFFNIGLVLDSVTETKLLAFLGSYIVGQGLADSGKEAAKIGAGVAGENIPKVAK